ncbi:MAG: helix-turn-helix domain-containing protein [Oscillospiraceae bacterium]|nr:helix-turn-helix domain-containing protein [Oscillospiraceae bacterium]
MDERTPGYYAVIPASVRYDDKIPANAKLLYGEISALVGSEGYCFASNSYFAQIYKLSERTIRGLIESLRDNGYITVQVERSSTGSMERRKIFLSVSAADVQGAENFCQNPGKYFPEWAENFFRYTNTSNTDIEKENIKESPSPKEPKKKSTPKTDFDPLPLFIAWIDQQFSHYPATSKNALYQALVRFSENRASLKKPMKSKGAVTALCNRLMRLSDGTLASAIDLLDTATSSGWQSVYPPKAGYSGTAPKQTSGRVWEEL